MGSIPGSGRSPGGGNGNPIQYSCLGDTTDRGTWQAIVAWGCKSQTQLTDQTTTITYNERWVSFHLKTFTLGKQLIFFVVEHFPCDKLTWELTPLHLQIWSKNIVVSHAENLRLTEKKKRKNIPYEKSLANVLSSCFPMQIVMGMK